jgi:hypothetical protein
MQSRNLQKLNLVLVAVVSVSISIVRPAYLYAGPCEDAAEAEYAATLAGLEAQLTEAVEIHDVALANAQQALQVAENQYAQLVAGCDAILDADLYVIALEFLAGEIAITTFLTGCVASCALAGFVTCPGCAIEASLMMTALLLWVSDETDQAYDSWTECKEPFEAALRAAQLAYDEAVHAADAELAPVVAWCAYEGPAIAQVAYEAALAACQNAGGGGGG